MRSGGYIVFHDIGDYPINEQTDCRVLDFWKTLSGTKKEIVHNTSWNTQNCPLIGGIGLLMKE